MAPRKTPLKPKKRPRQARSQATYDALIEAAAHILEQRGLAGFTTNAVAERAGASIGSLYQYFPNKDALMAAVIDLEQQALSTALTDAARACQGQSLEAGIRQLVRAAINRQRATPRLNAAIDYEERRLPLAAAMARSEQVQINAVVTFLKAHYPERSGSALWGDADVLRTIVRGVIDHFIDRPSPDFRAAERQSVRAAIGFLRQ